MKRAKASTLACAGLLVFAVAANADALVGIAANGSCTVAIMQSGDSFESTGGSWVPAGNALTQAAANQCSPSGAIVAAFGNPAGTTVFAVTDAGYVLERICGQQWFCAVFGQTVFQLAGTQPAAVISATSTGVSGSPFLLMTSGGGVYEENVGGTPAARLTGNVFGAATASRPVSWGQLQQRFRDRAPTSR